jgi:type IV/VI secretion system ImpK/VasF family protein
MIFSINSWSDMMIAENISTSFLNKISPVQKFPLELGYFRSKLFITDAFTNPLVSAASPLISLLERVHIAGQLPEVEELQQHILHEFKAFFSKMHLQHYSEEFYILSNYLLCATTDELLGKTYTRLFGQNKTFQAFTPISQDDIGPEENFFKIINHLLTDPESFLDIIELSYYCLLIGFEGKYHVEHDGRLILDNLIESLYQTIQRFRSNKIQKLFKNYILKTKQRKKVISTKVLTLLLGLCLISLIALSQFWIKTQTQQMLNRVSYSMDWTS